MAQPNTGSGKGTPPPSAQAKKFADPAAEARFQVDVAEAFCRRAAVVMRVLTPWTTTPQQDQTKADRCLLAIAEAVEMKAGGHAREFLENYLNGAPRKKITVDSAEIINENSGIHRKIKDKISEYIGSNKRSSEQAGGPIVIYQGDFDKSESGQDWRLALGSFRFFWKAYGTDAAGRPTVLLWGSDTYRWHPEEPRPTQKVHQAAERLKTEMGAKEFEVEARPCSMVIETGEILKDQRAKTARY